MKKMMLFLVLLTNFVLADVVVGQQLPTVVDNSQWFPPVRSQEAIGNCTHFSAIYFLKSSIWNKKFNRDPKLEINQFNENFVWNQNSHPVYGVSDVESAFGFMQTQGCATIADLPANEQDVTIKPNFATREKALNYKSKRLFSGMFFGGRNGNIDVTKHISMLKDSLNQGKCFTLGIQLFRYFDKMTDKNNVYSCYQGISHDSVYYGHMFTIVGYNDTIKTAKGRGAFQVINSNSRVASGHFYLDYNWFYYDQQQPYVYYFLEEDFSSTPQVVANIKLDGVISGSELLDYKKLFVDTLLNYSGKKVDFVDVFGYFCKQNQIQVINVNGRRLKLRSKVVTKPLNNLDGTYELVSDLTDLSSSADFKSASIVVFDPISVNYVGSDNQSFYSYTRESKLSVEKAYINFVGTGKKIIAKVKDLADTTIVTNDFYSIVAGLNLKPFNENIYVKSCTSVLKRKLITFSVADLQTNTAPVFTQVPSGAISVKKGESVNFTFKATDAEKNPIVYSMTTSASGASINPSTGLFQYQASQVGTPSFTVKASDGIETISTTFTITVTDPSTNPLVFTKTPSVPVKIVTNEVYKFQFAASGPEGKTLKFSVDPPAFSFITVSINETTGEFSFSSKNGCGVTSVIKLSDGTETIFFRLDMVVDIAVINNPPAFTQIPNGDLKATAGDLVSFTFKATDPENSPITYSIGGGLGASIDASTGLFKYQTSQVGTFAYRIDATDGANTVSTMANIKVSSAVNNPPVFTQIPNGDLTATTGDLVSFTLKATDPENAAITYSIVSGTGASIDPVTGIFKYQSSQVGSFAFTVNASDGINAVSTIVNVKVSAVANNAPTFVNPPGTLVAYINKTFSYQFEATDKDGDRITFSILNSLPEAQLTSDGKLTFKSDKVNTYRFTVVASDGKATTNLAVAIKVDLVDDVEEVVVPDYSVSIYPNPVVDNMNIKVVSKNNTSINMTIYDIQGRAMSTVINECSVGDNTFNYEASTLKSGVYICKFVANNTVLQTIKIIKK
jgi:hypothetical protein